MGVYAVVDTETTGLGKHDRVVEIAVVLFDPERDDVIDEFDTLINPLRDIGPTDIHGLTPSMVSAAPTFEEIAPSLSARIDQTTLVAHNLRFDVRMLQQEYDRTAARLVAGQGICTLSLSGQKLAAACDRHGITLGHHHRALADARATAELLRRYLDESLETTNAFIEGNVAGPTPRTLRRDLSGEPVDVMPLRRVVRGVGFPTSDQAILSYLDALDWVLDDLVIDDAERQQLTGLASILGLEPHHVDRAHRAYFNSLVTGALRDNIVTDDEHRLMSSVADLLGLDDVDIPEITAVRGMPSELMAGWRVCFTGTAVIDGVAVDRADVEATASTAGLHPVGSVTKQCDLLVCADTNSMSSKARKARQYGIPIMDFDQFVRKLGFVGVDPFA